MVEAQMYIATWARTFDASGQQGLISKGSGTGAGTYYLYFDGTNNIVAIVDNQTTSEADSPARYMSSFSKA